MNSVRVRGTVRVGSTKETSHVNSIVSGLLSIPSKSRAIALYERCRGLGPAGKVTARPTATNSRGICRVRVMGTGV